MMARIPGDEQPRTTDHQQGSQSVSPFLQHAIAVALVVVERVDLARIGDVDASGVPQQSAIELHGHAIQCRITTEDPTNNFMPDTGRLLAFRSAGGFGGVLSNGDFFGALYS